MRSNFSQSTGKTLKNASAQRAGVLLELAERVLQSVESVAHTTLDGVLSDAGYLGDVSEWEVRDFAQQKHLTLIVWKRINCLDDRRTHLGRQDVSFGARVRARIRDRFGEG